MGSKDWESIDNFSNESKDVYIAFLDVLGYKDKAELFFSNKFNLEGRFRRALKTVNDALTLASFVTDTTKLSIKFFSDSIIVSHPKNDDGLTSLLNAACVISANLSYEGLFIRGGISHGPHAESGEGTLSNPFFLASLALQKAYHIENNATYPRIIIDDDLISGLNEMNKSLVVKNGGHYIAHFAKYIINDQGANLNDAIKEVREIQAMMENKDEHIREKYQWLIDYYLWTMTPISSTELREQCILAGEKQGFSFI